MQDIMNQVRLNLLLMSKTHKIQWIMSLVVAVTAFTKNLWLIALIVFGGTLIFGMKKLFTTSLYEVDGYTYLSFPASFESVAFGKLLTAGTEVFLLNLSMAVEVILIKTIVFKGEPSVMGTYLYGWFMDAEGSNALLVQIIQCIDIAVLCYAFPAIALMLVTLDKIVIKNGHYANTILVAIILVLGVWMIGEGYQITMKLALIQLAAFLAVTAFCMWQTFMFMKETYYIRNPIDY